jgi:hypothetical protein
VLPEFVTKVLYRLDKDGYNINVYHVSSAELYDANPKMKGLLFFRIP